MSGSRRQPPHGPSFLQRFRTKPCQKTRNGVRITICIPDVDVVNLNRISPKYLVNKRYFRGPCKFKICFRQHVASRSASDVLTRCVCRSTATMARVAIFAGVMSSNVVVATARLSRCEDGQRDHLVRDFSAAWASRVCSFCVPYQAIRFISLGRLVYSLSHTWKAQRMAVRAESPLSCSRSHCCSGDGRSGSLAARAWRLCTLGLRTAQDRLIVLGRV